MEARIYIKYHFFVYLLHILFVNGSRSSIKIVEEPANYVNNLESTDQGDQLTARVKPSNFSGPEQLRSLCGKCFNWTDNKYKYNFCPFNNITQHELSFRWNLYQGVLGVWEGWEIINNTFSTMIYASGSECGESDRDTRVLLLCGEKNKLLNVTEPSKCHYEVVFSTPLTCHRDALLVYPRLPINLQKKWDDLENQLHFGEITDTGYKAWLDAIFVEAGYKIKKKDKPAANNRNRTVTSSSVDAKPQFSDFAECKAAFANLNRELELLKEEIAKIKNSSAITGS